MSVPSARPSPRRVLGPTVPVVAAATLAVAYGSGLSTGTGLVLAAVGLAAAVGLRATGRPRLAEVAPLPLLGILGFLAVATPVAAVPELLVGFSGVAFVAWLLDDPYRPPAGASRGTLVWAIPAFAVGIAWASRFLLPSTAASLGVAAGLLVVGLVVLAFLVGRPELFDRDEASTI